MNMHKSKLRKSSSWIKRKDKLGGSGFISKSQNLQHKILDQCVAKYGYRSCLGSIMVLNRNRSIKSKHGDKITSLRNWLKNKYGGKGAFGSSPKRTKRRTRKSRKTSNIRSRKYSKKSSRKSRLPLKSESRISRKIKSCNHGVNRLGECKRKPGPKRSRKRR